MDSYTDIIEGFVDEFAAGQDEVRIVVVETAERFRDDFYRIVDADEDEFDKGVLDGFYDEVRLEIAEALKACGLL